MTHGVRAYALQFPSHPSWVVWGVLRLDHLAMGHKRELENEMVTGLVGRGYTGQPVCLGVVDLREP